VTSSVEKKKRRTCGGEIVETSKLTPKRKKAVNGACHIKEVGNVQGLSRGEGKCAWGGKKE